MVQELSCPRMSRVGEEVRRCGDVIVKLEEVSLFVCLRQAESCSVTTSHDLNADEGLLRR